MIAQYGHVLLFVIFSAGFAVANLLILSPLLRFKSNDTVQKTAYECGFEPIGTPYVPMDINFYIFALLFVVFDVESLFLYPWAVIFRSLGWNGFISMLVFIGVLLFGLIYAWREGALQWEK